MPERIARSLLEHVFYRASAVAVVKKGGGCAIKVIDTEFGTSYVTLPEGAKEIWLISNHPEGQTAPYEADRENIRMIREQAPRARIRLFICGEDIGCREMELVQMHEL